MSLNARPARPLAALGGFCGVAFTIVALQVVVSRFFAGTMTYYYAFMLVSLAMLGLASGGLIVQLFPARFVPGKMALHAARCCFAMGVTLYVGFQLVLLLYPRVHTAGSLDHGSEDYASLAAIFWGLFPPFFFGGMCVSLVLIHAREKFHRLYAADLASAALGAVAAIVLLRNLTPVEAIFRVLVLVPMLAGVTFALAARRERLALFGLAGTLMLALSGSLLARIPQIARPPHLLALGRPMLVNEWNAISAVRVHPNRFFTWALSPRYAGPEHPMADLLIDGLGGTQIVRFDGRVESLPAYGYLGEDLTQLAHVLAGKDGRQLIIGPGGGVDILQAEWNGRRDITAVEINPLVARVVNQDMGAFSGAPYRLPGVRVFIDNGRTFMKRSHETWDLISLTWVDTGGSANALAYSENYLYTVEAYREYLQHLSPGGYFGFLRALGAGESMRIDSLRGVAVAVEALRREGAATPGDHLLVAAVASPWFQRPMCFVLVKKTPYGAADVAAAQAFLAAEGFQPLWLPGGAAVAGADREPFAPFTAVIHDLVTTQDPQRLYREAAYDIAPTTDDNPFYFVERGGERRAAGFGVSQLRSYLLILLSLVVPFLLLPLVRLLRQSGRVAGTAAAAVGYFALLGIGFMLVEIEFFHVFALVLGNPAVTLAVVLAGMLVASGLGSLCGSKLAAANRLVSGGAFLALCLLLFGFGVGKHAILDLLIPLSLGGRVFGTLVVIAPVAFALGLPMSTGMSLLKARPDLMLWGWALNGVFSVLSSVAAIFLAIHFGIERTFLIGLLCYVVAALLFMIVRTRPPQALAPAR